MVDSDVTMETALNGGSDNFDIDDVDFSGSKRGRNGDGDMPLFDDFDAESAAVRNGGNTNKALMTERQEREEFKSRGLTSNGKGKGPSNINGSQQQQDQMDQTVSTSRRIRANVRETGFDSMKYYMKTMGNHDLLQKNEEIVLAREIQILIKWEEKREELEAELLR